jgi:hypothetical protein
LFSAGPTYLVKFLPRFFNKIYNFKYHKIQNIENYHLTFSAADGNDADVRKAIKQGYNVATVFGLKKTEPMPDEYMGLPVFNGDESDLRFLDPEGVVVGLYAKGRAKKDTSGFVKYPTVILKAA